MRILKAVRAARLAATALATGATMFVAGTACAQAAPAPGSVTPAPATVAVADCAKLRFSDMTKLSEGPTQISLAREVAAADGLPEYCEVEGYVWPNVRFRVRLPKTQWNGKLLFVGGGGQMGALPNGGPSVAHGDYSQLQRGYALVYEDGGHFSTFSDTKWAWNNLQAMLDFGVRSSHVATVAAKTVIERYYGKEPVASYFNGCSNSGRQAMVLAQRFPLDFDGIIAGSPSMDPSDLMGNMLFMAELLRDQSRQGFDRIAAVTLHKAVIGQCDGLDGKKDGIISDPRRCQVDFKPLLCQTGAGDNCLTGHQIDIARQIYAGARRPNGTQITRSSAFPGSEVQWIDFLTPPWVIGYAGEYFQFEGLYPAPGAALEPKSADLAQYMARTGVSDTLISATNPDIRKFKQRGGKLISFYGWGDPVGGSRTIMDYYETVERVMGGRKQTEDFFRLFMAPGMDHCRGGEGASVFDFVGALDTWVQTGQVPDKLTGYHPGPDGKPQFEGTITPYRTAAAR